MLIPHETSYIFSSDPATGAITSPDGSEFTVNFSPAFEIPKDAINVTLSVENASIWWTVPNIITGENDTLRIYGDNDMAGQQLFTITIPQGLYDLSGIQTAIHTQLEAAGARTLDVNNNPLPLINLLADDATQRVLLRFNYTNVYVEFVQNSPYKILGFLAGQTYGPYPGAPINILADNTAAFNTVSSFIVTTDLINKGIRINNSYFGIIANILIDVPPGSQITYQPFNPAKIEANELIGSKRTQAKIYLKNQSLQSVNTNSEYWSIRVVFRWMHAMEIKK